MWQSIQSKFFNGLCKSGRWKTKLKLSPPNTSHTTQRQSKLLKSVIWFWTPKRFSGEVCLQLWIKAKPPNKGLKKGAPLLQAEEEEIAKLVSQPQIYLRGAKNHPKLLHCSSWNVSFQAETLFFHEMVFQSHLLEIKRISRPISRIRKPFSRKGRYFWDETCGIFKGD